MPTRPSTTRRMGTELEQRMAKLHPLAAIAKAQEARRFLEAFSGTDFGEFAEPSHHDRRHLAAALDHMEELAAMVLALAEQCPTLKSE